MHYRVSATQSEEALETNPIHPLMARPAELEPELVLSSCTATIELKPLGFAMMTVGTTTSQLATEVRGYTD
jgi:hypothetical protein